MVQVSFLYCVVFDLDNTLYDQADDVHQRLLSVVELCGLRSVKDEFVQFCLDEWATNGPKKPLIDMAFDRFEIDCPRNKAIERYRSVETTLNLDTKTRETLLNLSAHGVRISVVTNGREKLQKGKFDSLGLGSLVNEFHIATGEKAKPNPFYLKRSCAGFPSERCLMVGDWYAVDGLAAERAGVPYAHLSSGPIRELIPATVPVYATVDSLFKF